MRAAAVFSALAFVNAAQLRVNPVRKVVSLMQKMTKQVTAEGEKEEELYEKFQCYCKNGEKSLGKSIADAETKIPEMEAALKENAGKKEQLRADLKAHKADREQAKTAMAEATSLREKQASEYAKESSETTADLEALGKAVKAISSGMGGSFLQASTSKVLHSIISDNADMSADDRELVTAFLQSSEGSEYSPRSGEILGILKQLGDEMSADLAEMTKTEETSKANYEELIAAKKKEKASLTKQIETKSERLGELGVEDATAANDLEDTTEALADDKKFLADLDGNCAAKAAAFEANSKMRSQELLALADTIKLLNDDDALELFKKTLPSASAASFLQVQVTAKEVKARALDILRKGNLNGRPELDLISLALSGKKVGFEKVLTMIDGMVTTMKAEQADDDEKKQYCAAEFDEADDKKKKAEQTINDIETSMGDASETITKVTVEIQAVADGIAALDKSVAEATAQRQEENTDFKQLMAENGAAKDLLAMAKNRLNQFYNPKLYVAPPKRELSEEDRIAVNMGGTAPPTPAPNGIAGTDISASFVQISAHTQNDEAPPAAPKTAGKFEKSEENSGVTAMMDLLVADIDKEMTTAETEEKNSQAAYEKMMADAKEKRAVDSKMKQEKEGALADAQAHLESLKEDKAAAGKQLATTVEYIQALHADCDWLVQFYDTRKEARANEVDALEKAKAVLNGADYSLLQVASKKRHFLA